jgi:hypothetical protein
MKRIIVSLATVATLVFLTLGASFAGAKGGCCPTSACCKGGACCRHHSK